MDRRLFLKLGLAASGTILATGSLPFAAAAKGEPSPVMDAAGQLGVGGAGSVCGANDACVTIDPDIFAANIRHLKEDIGPDVKLCIVMKSDAYAHGVDILMPEALKARPARIGMTGNGDIRKAVGIMDETGMRATILRIAPATFFEAAEAALNNWPIEELIGSLAQAEMLARLARWIGEKRGKKIVLPVHINVDTGMGRMGFVRVEDIKKAMDLPELKVRGIMTHYANAYDLERGADLTRKQLEKFDAVLAQLDLPGDVIVHTANSGATLSFPWTRRNMVRPGGALYGDVPPGNGPRPPLPQGHDFLPLQRGLGHGGPAGHPGGVRHGVPHAQRPDDHPGHGQDRIQQRIPPAGLHQEHGGAHPGRAFPGGGKDLP